LLNLVANNTINKLFLNTFLASKCESKKSREIADKSTQYYGFGWQVDDEQSNHIFCTLLM